MECGKKKKNTGLDYDDEYFMVPKVFRAKTKVASLSEVEGSLVLTSSRK